jgi:hypothetical protein
MNKYKIVLFLLFVLSGLSSFANGLLLCLSGANGKINVMLSLDGDEWKKGQSKYCGQNTSMNLNQKKYFMLKSFKDHPSVFLIQWDEYLVGKKTGYYSVELQGANFYNGYYFNYRTKKKTMFSINTIESKEECSCN